MYIQRIKAVYERAHVTYPDNPEIATPLRWVFFDDEALNKWWDRWKSERGPDN